MERRTEAFAPGGRVRGADLDSFLSFIISLSSLSLFLSVCFSLTHYLFISIYLCMYVSIYLCFAPPSFVALDVYLMLCANGRLLRALHSLLPFRAQVLFQQHHAVKYKMATKSGLPTAGFIFCCLAQMEQLRNS